MFWWKFFQVLLAQAKEKAKLAGVEFRGRIFDKDKPLPSTTKIKVAEKENLQKVMKLENKVNAQVEDKKTLTGESHGYLSCLITLSFKSRPREQIWN